MPSTVLGFFLGCVKQMFDEFISFQFADRMKSPDDFGACFAFLENKRNEF